MHDNAGPFVLFACVCALMLFGLIPRAMAVANQTAVGFRWVLMMYLLGCRPWMWPQVRPVCVLIAWLEAITEVQVE